MCSNMVFSSDKAIYSTSETPLCQERPVWTFSEPSQTNNNLDHLNHLWTIWTILESSRSHQGIISTISEQYHTEASCRENMHPWWFTHIISMLRGKSCSFHLPSKIKMCPEEVKVPTTIWKHPILKDLTDGNILIKMTIRPFGSLTIRTFRLPCDLTSWVKTVLTSLILLRMVDEKFERQVCDQEVTGSNTRLAKTEKERTRLGVGVRKQTGVQHPHQL